MKKFMKFCGFILSHSVWSIFEGDILIPFGAYKEGEQEIIFTRFTHDENNYELAVNQAENYLVEESTKKGFSAICFEAYSKNEKGEMVNTIYMIGRVNDGENIKELVMTLPYYRAETKEIEKIEKMNLVDFRGFNKDEIEECYDEFWEGLESHEQGGKIWIEKMKD